MYKFSFKMRYLLLLLFIGFSFSQQFQKVDFIVAKADLRLNEKTKSISGTAEYDFNVRSAVDSIRIDAKNMQFDSVAINNKNVNFRNSNKQLILFEGYKKGSNKLTFHFKANPTQTLYFLGSKADNNLQIWTQGQGKYTSHWLPSFDDVNEKVIFEISATFDSDYKLISNGKLTQRSINNSQETKWQYKMKYPMSSYLLLLTIGKFDYKTEKSAFGTVLENYYQPKDAVKFEFTYKHSKEIFNYLENQIGVKYPWEIYRQIPIEDFLYAGMENTTTTLFSQDFVVDATGFNDKNFCNVSAHEQAHHWFGNLITAKSGKHHWLQEGFATFYALLAERKLFGDDYFYYQMFINAQQVSQASRLDTIPVLSEKASSLSFYQKGSLALFTIYDKIGEKNFQKVIKNYLNKYKFKNVETHHFLNEILKVTDFDVITFQKNWLNESRFQSEEIDVLLSKNEFIKQLKAIQGRKKYSFAENEPYFDSVLRSDLFYPAKTEIINQIKNVPFEIKQKLIRTAIQTNDIAVRQAVANTVEEVPKLFSLDYETFLNDASYETQQISLMRLWIQFPERQLFYLEKAKNWNASNDLNLRITYLFLSQLNTNFDAIESKKNLIELINYTSSKFDSSVRRNAFEVALQLKDIDSKVLENLVDATVHFKWQFNKFARGFLRNLLKIDQFRKRYNDIKVNFSDENKVQIEKFLDEKL